MARVFVYGLAEMIDQDAQFFMDHPDRFARIRMPGKEIGINKQRATQVIDEGEMEFRSLGSHERSRRRMLVWRMRRDPCMTTKAVVLRSVFTFQRRRSGGQG